MANEALVERYEKGIEAFEGALNNVPQEMLDRRPAPDKWSIREIAAKRTRDRSAPALDRSRTGRSA